MDFIEISITFVPKSIPLPYGFSRNFYNFRTQKPTPPLWILLKFLQLSCPKAYPSPRDFIEISITFVPKSLPLPYGFYWNFYNFRTQKPTPPLWILGKFLQLSCPKAYPSPKDFIEISITFVPKSLLIAYGFYWTFYNFPTQKPTPPLWGFIEISITFVPKDLPLP